ncbi:DNA topoisomerase 1 [bacterium BMS3Abin05]|nr:DNA topoisomerase 1 [bacterium BMS3Abin05]GBE26960.1 DNA topoisomerase 1 [bacterium BMS3Bbin03]HDL78602.1 type I DNA topoisomerase [Bacteroidota bacterium]
MPKSLVIVESVAKTKTINHILGKDYVVKASVGHVKDLPKNRLAVDIENEFEPDYITIKGKGKILQELRKLAKSSDQVYIATDPDREGEAIAYHLANELKEKNGNVRRVLFNEITKSGVTRAIAHPTTINLKKVNAQKARRVLDRLVGYKVSPVLWKTVYRGLSAGRVQTVALRLICEREEAIEAFVAEEYWSIKAELKGEKTEPFFSELVKISGKKIKIPNETSAAEHVEHIRQAHFVVSSVVKKTVKRSPSPPFTTSTLQQEAARRFGFSSARIMAIAQQLYEGIELGSKGSVGLITYMRTDSTRIAEEALEAARVYIADNYGSDYVPDKPRRFKTSKNAQDAHEAIRPASMAQEPKKIARYLTRDQRKLFELIWSRFVASQMAPAILDQTTIEIEAGEYLFRTTGSVMKFRGFLQAYEDSKEPTDEEEKKNGHVPGNLKKNDRLELLGLTPEQHFTKPPARFSESTLIKELDHLGIGRPSTYAVIISTLLNRKYAEREARRLFPTELGRTVNNILIQYFPQIFDVHFTAIMETRLDLIEAGKRKTVEVLQEFYDSFEKALSEVDQKMDQIKKSLQEKTEETCPECGKPLVVKWGRNGKFLACSGYPECKYTRPLKEDELQTTDEKCPKCESPLVVKVGRYGRFLACSNYPKCKFTKPFTLGIPCPKEGCVGEIVERRTKRGKVFYGCSRYPECDFASWHKPLFKKCANCGNPYLEEHYTKSKGNFLKCPNCKVEFAFSPETETTLK